MSVTLSAGSVVAQPGQQINVASLLNVTAGNNPTYLVVSLLDRNEYTASSNGDTGTLSGNGQTVGFDYLWGDNETTGIVFTCDTSSGQYTNPTFGDLSNLVYTTSTNPGDNTSVSIFTTEDSDIANQYANDPLTLVSYAPSSTNYVGSVAVTTAAPFCRADAEPSHPPLHYPSGDEFRRPRLQHERMLDSDKQHLGRGGRLAADHQHDARRAGHGERRVDRCV